MKPMIELSSVSKRYRGRVETAVFEEIDLAVDAGEVVLVSGTTGAGKSTLLKLLYAAEFADRGRVSVFGRDLARLRRSSIALLRRRVGVVPQAFALLRDLSALRNVALALEVRAVPQRDVLMRAAEALGAVGMTVDLEIPVSRLSEGERQRVAIARALVGEPAILVADEPTAHLDSEGREIFIDVLIDVQSRGGAALVATNDHNLLAAGARCSWRHLELCNGSLRTVADRKPSLIDGIEPEIEIETEPVPELAPGPEPAPEAVPLPAGVPAPGGQAEPRAGGAETGGAVDTNVVPFPLVARAGGMSK